MEAKMKIVTKAEYDVFRAMMTKEAFFNKFDLSMEVTSAIAADKKMVYAEFTERAMTAKEMRLFARGAF